MVVLNTTLVCKGKSLNDTTIFSPGANILKSSKRSVLAHKSKTSDGIISLNGIF